MDEEKTFTQLTERDPEVQSILREQNEAFAGQDVVIHTAAKAGIWGDRADYVRSNVTATENVIEVYRDLLSGRRAPSDVWRQLSAMNRVVVTRGTLEKRDPLAII